MMNRASFVAWLTLTGCAAPGERASTCGFFCPETRCPAGEICSTDTPSGLYFEGDDTGAPGVTAVGGRQTLTLYEGQRYGGQGTQLTRPFDASSTDPSLRVVSIRPPRITLEGVASGSAYLRIFKPGTEWLYDRIALEAANLQGAALRAEGARDDHWALLAGQSTRVFVWLHDARGRRLIDNSARVEVDPASEVRAGVIHSGWGELAVNPATPGTLRWIVVAGVAMGRTMSTRVVDRIDDILVASVVQLTDSSPVRARQFACFRALNGLDVVSILSWNFSGNGAIVTQLFGCVILDWPAGTPASVTASVQEFAKTFALPLPDVRTSASTDLLRMSELAGSQAGERADTQLGR